MAPRTLLASILVALAAVAPVARAQEAGDPRQDPDAAAGRKVDRNASAAKEESADAASAAAEAERAATEAKAEAAAATQALEAAEAAAKDAAEALEVAQASLQAAQDGEAAAREKAEAEAAVEAAKARAEQAEAARAAAEQAADQAAERAANAADAAKAAAERQAVAAARVGAAEAAQAAMERVARMRRGPSVPIDELELRLIPLTQDELAAEADAWLEVLQTRVAGLSYAEIAAKTATGDQRAQLLEALNRLREEKTAVGDRLKTVLKAFEFKGGDPAAYRRYMAAVSGTLRVDVKDADATYTAIRGWLTSSEGGLRWLKNIVLFLVTLVVAKLLASVAGAVAGRALRAERVKASALLQNFLINMVRKVVLLIGLVVALDQLEVNVGPLMAAMGGAAFVLGFALQGTLSNFAAGIMLLLYRPYDIGNVVEAAGVRGKVDAMSIVSTTLVTPDNQEIVIPNAKIWGGIIINVTARAERRVDLVFGVGYDDDLAQAEGLLREIVTGHPKVLATPEPVVRVAELADSSVNFFVRPWVKTPDYGDVSWDITRQVKDRFDAAGISIPYPQSDVHLHTVAAANADDSAQQAPGGLGEGAGSGSAD